MALLDPRRNHLIGMLPTSAYERIAPHLEPVQLAAGDALLEPESAAAVDAAFFPLGPIVSLDQVVTDPYKPGDPMAGIALVGAEGLVGIELVLGGQSAIARATVRVSGGALRISADALRAEFARGTALQRLLLGAADALISQLANNSACERVHSPVQRLVRWLLLIDDRAERPDLMLTQEALAQFMGVRRETVSVAAGRLQRAGLITYRRGTLVIAERAALESRACACYRAIRKRYDALPNPRA
jgi:CRP-like cAMP-binding protein